MPVQSAPYNVPEELNDPNGDIILCSSDQVEFRVFRWPLQRLSPVFSDMFTLPDPGSASPEASAQPIVQMDETAPVIEAILRLSYPIDPPIIKDLHTMALVTEAIVKLQAERRCKWWIRMTVDNLVPVNPWALYAILLALGRKGCDYNLEEEVRIAARGTVGRKILRTWKEASMITAADYDRLLIYHTECKKAFFKAEEEIWSKLGVRWPWFYSHCAKEAVMVGGASVRVPRWFSEFRREARGKFCEELRGEVVEDVSLWYEQMEIHRATGSAGLCGQCARSSALRMPAYARKLSELMDEVVTQVSGFF